MRHGVHQRLPRAADRPEQAPQASPAPVQMRAAAARASRHDIASIPLAEVTQRRPNRTGLPDGLKTGIETLSGLSMDHVRVHHGSAEPARIGALAHARGADIHLGPGQERHLPHEAWHVVQQAQGRVRPTMQLKRGDALNDDSALEREADTMGGLARRSPRAPAHTGTFQPATSLPGPRSPAVVQAYRIETSSTQRELLRSQSPAPGIQPATRIVPAKLAYPQQLTRSGQANFRVADDRSMAVQDTINEPKDFFAKDAVFDTSNRRLAQAGSPVRLTKSGGQVKFGNNTLRKIRPDRPADRQYREFASLWSDICITIANHIMGNRGQHKEDVVLQSGAQQASASITVGGLESSGIDRLAAHLSGRARPTLDAASTAIRTGPGDRPGKRYGLASAGDRFDEKARGLGVNEFARPEVGEGFATFSVFAKKNDEARAWDYTTGARRNKKSDQIWGYHHAAVVARSLDGNDWMTLENYNRGDQVRDKAYEFLLQKYSRVAREKVNALRRANRPEKEIALDLQYYLLYQHQGAHADYQREQANLATPTLWFFRMYGSRLGQSFHEQQAASGAYVNPLTVRIRKDVVGELDRTEALVLDSIAANNINWSSARAPLDTLAHDTTQAFADMRDELTRLKDARTGDQRTAGLQQVNDDYTTWLDNTFVPRMAAALRAIKRGTVGPTDTLEDLKAELDSPETLGLLSRVGYGIYDFFNDLFSSNDSRARLTSLANLRTAVNDVPAKVV